jgi:hypothetical protein
MCGNGPAIFDPIHTRNLKLHSFIIGEKRINLTFFVQGFGAPKSTFIVRSLAMGAGHWKPELI